MSTMRSLVLLLLAILIAPGARGESIRLTVEEPSGVARTAWPVTSGIPFAQGLLANTKHVALFASDAEDA